MNNYYEILARGSNYAASAALIWQKRKYTIGNTWCGAQPADKKQRVSKLLSDLTERIDQLAFLMHSIRLQQELLTKEAEAQFIILECSNQLCQDGPGGFIMSVKANRFEEGDYHCGNCGCEMRIEGSSEVDEMLEDMGITVSRFA